MSRFSGTIAAAGQVPSTDVATNTWPPPSVAMLFTPANDNRRGDWIQTFRGGQFWPMDPRSEEVHIEDIAHSLSMQCRFVGHCRNFYSVAEHSVLLARCVSPANALWSLLHDATEAYLTDVPRPVKPFLAEYKPAELRLEAVIAQRFGLPLPMPQEVHDFDKRILTDEMQQNMAEPPVPWSTAAVPLGIELRFWTPKRAKLEFLDMYEWLALGKTYEMEAA